MLSSFPLGLLGLVGQALSVPIVEDNSAIVDLTTSLVFGRTLQEFNDYINGDNIPNALLVNTEGCPLVPGPFGPDFQNACRRHEFALRSYWRQGRLTKDNKGHIKFQFKQDLNERCLEGDESCMAMAKTYYQAIQAYGITRAAKVLARYSTEPETPADNKTLMPCDLAKQAYLNGTATEQTIRDLKLCDFLERIMHAAHNVPHHHVAHDDEAEGKEQPEPFTGVPAVEEEARALLDDLKMSCRRFENFVVNHAHDAGTDNKVDEDQLEILEDCNKLGFLLHPIKVHDLSRRGDGKGQTMCGGAFPMSRPGRKRLNGRGDMTGSDSDFEPCNTSVASVDSAFEWDIWEVEHLVPLASPANDTAKVAEEESMQGELDTSSQHGDNATRAAGGELRARKWGQTQCHTEEHSSWRKRGDMTGSDSDFEPCGTSGASVESGDEWSTWEVEHVDDTSTTSKVPEKKSAGEVIRSLLTADPESDGGNPHTPEFREAMLQKYCETLQYDVEVWGNGKDDGIGDNLEEMLMMNTCRILGHYNVRDREDMSMRESATDYTENDQACPNTEDCEHLSGTEYNTSEESVLEWEPHQNPSMLHRRDASSSTGTDSSEDSEDVGPAEQKEMIQKMIFNTTLQEFMDAEFGTGPHSHDPDFVYPQCKNVTAASHGWGSHGWNWHDACVRFEYGNKFGWLLADPEDEPWDAQRSFKKELGKVFEKDLLDACDGYRLSIYEDVRYRYYPRSSACRLFEPYYFYIATELNAKVASQLFNLPEKVVMHPIFRANGEGYEHVDGTMPSEQ